MLHSEMIIWSLSVTAALAALGYATKAVYHAALRRAYREGWTAAANWAGRNDLHYDVDSPAYLHEQNVRLGIR